MPADSDAVARALLSLDGLSLGDAFGECFLRRWADRIDESTPDTPSSIPVPPPPWPWTDDTAMAVELVRHLQENGGINPECLSLAFATAYMKDPRRGYGASIQRLLVEIYAGRPWREAACQPFDGAGSMGNGSAMRVAPLGAYFADRVDQPAAIMAEAEKSAVVTHPHPEGVAGAQAIALAAALAVRRTPSVFASELWPYLLEALPSSHVRDGAARGSQLGADARLADVAGALGNGSGVICPDTVPVCLWLAAHSGGDFEMAMRRTAAISGDIDTNCAIVGGIVCLLEGARLPHEWRRRRMPVPLLAD